MSGRSETSGRRLPRRFRFLEHLSLFVVVSTALLLAKFAFGQDWSLFWPLLVWSALVALHYFISSSFDVDEAWLEGRVSDLQSRSYDFDHIRSIEKRVDEKDDSVTPHTERKR